MMWNPEASLIYLETFRLCRLGYSVANIVEYFRLHGIHVSRQRIEKIVYGGDGDTFGVLPLIDKGYTNEQIKETLKSRHIGVSDDYIEMFRQKGRDEYDTGLESIKPKKPRKIKTKANDLIDPTSGLTKETNRYGQPVYGTKLGANARNKPITLTGKKEGNPYGAKTPKFSISRPELNWDDLPDVCPDCGNITQGNYTRDEKRAEATCNTCGCVIFEAEYKPYHIPSNTDTCEDKERYVKEQWKKIEYIITCYNNLVDQLKDEDKYRISSNKLEIAMSNIIEKSDRLFEYNMILKKKLDEKRNILGSTVDEYYRKISEQPKSESEIQPLIDKLANELESYKNLRTTSTEIIDFCKQTIEFFKQEYAILRTVSSSSNLRKFTLLYCNDINT